MTPARGTGAPPPKKVSFCTDARAWPGGAEVYLTGLMRWLRGAGWDVALLTTQRPATADWVKLLREEGFPVSLARPVREIDPRGAAEAARLLAGAPLVHFNKTDPRTCLPAVEAARRVGARVVVATEHIAKAPESHYPLGARVVAGLVRRSNRWVDRILVSSETSRRMYIENYRCDPGKVETVRLGIDPRPFERLPDRDAARRALGLGPGDVVAAAVGRLCEGKGQGAAIAATPAIARELPEFRLLVVGRGPLEGELRELARSSGASGHVVFAGFWPDLREVLAAADLFLLSSEAESLPLSILEAMAAGLPVVATDVGGVPEAVAHGVTGLLVPARRPDELARAVLDVLARTDRGRSMGLAGRERVRSEFDVSACHAKVAALYEELLEAHHA